MVSYYQHLAEQYQYQLVRHLKTGDVITWGAAVVAARVVSNTENGFVVQFADGKKDYWQNRYPPGITLLPEGTPLGFLPQEGDTVEAIIERASMCIAKLKGINTNDVFLKYSFRIDSKN